ncbi:MAG: 50S ribosomal protein L21 [Armatimonadetes bacterium]|nr:50S ribosomal protein L21 [Armatimonadota bacterium]
MYAIIETGGKQYRAEEGADLEVEKLDGDIGQTVSFDKVLLVADEKVHCGSPYLDGASVQGTIVKQTQADKIVVFRYKSKKRYRKKTGHRQKLTCVKIDKIAIP